MGNWVKGKTTLGNWVVEDRVSLIFGFRDVVGCSDVY